MCATMDYDDFNMAIWMLERQRMFSCNELMPMIEEKNRLVHTLEHHGNLLTTATASLHCHLAHVKKHLKDLVLLAKSKWYSNVCSHMHDMRISPKTPGRTLEH